MKRYLVYGVLAGVLATPALASQCPTVMKEIDEALAGKPKLSAEQVAEVKKLRIDGEKLHIDGKHKESVEMLNKAKEMLTLQ